MADTRSLIINLNGPTLPSSTLAITTYFSCSASLNPVSLKSKTLQALPSAETKQPYEEEIILSPITPLQNKHEDELIFLQDLAQRTYHQVSKVEFWDEKTHTYINGYFKKNPVDNLASELEAVMGEFYKLIAPNHTPGTYAVYNKNGIYIGVLSEEINNFLPLSVDPLQEDDLEIKFFEENNNDFVLFDRIDAKLREFERCREKLNRQMKYLERAENKVEEKYIESLNAQINCSLALQKNHAAWCNYCIEIKTKFNLTHRMIERYRILKGLAISLTASYILVEDDLHQNNISKLGWHFDFDMAWWHFIYKIVNKGMAVSSIRKPAESTLTVSERDILEFPNVRDFKPYYWPALAASDALEAVSNTIKNFVPLSTNAYPPQAYLIYQKLGSNPIFVHHKFATLLRYILTNGEMYVQLAKSHMLEERTFQQKPIIESLGSDHASRIRNFEKVLKCIPSFAQFFKMHGRRVFDQLNRDIQERNNDYKKKLVILTSEIKNLRTFMAENPDCAEAKQKYGRYVAEKMVCKAQIIDLQQIEIAYNNVNSIFDLFAEQNAEKNTGLMRAKAAFENLLAAVNKSMDAYKNPGLFYGNGLARTHISEAKQLVDYCTELSVRVLENCMKLASETEPGSQVDAYVSAITSIKLKVNEFINKVGTGTMHEHLSKLMQDNTLWELAKVGHVNGSKPGSASPRVK